MALFGRATIKPSRFSRVPYPVEPVAKSKKRWKQIGQRIAVRTSYAYRQEVLNRNGFASYADYLASDLWADIRRRVLERDGGCCVICSKTASQVHHTSYGDVTIRGERLDKLFSLCGSCHVGVEFKGGVKQTFEGAKRQLEKRQRNAQRHPEWYDRPLWSYALGRKRKLV